MWGGSRWCSTWVLLWAAACTQDFSSFHFGDTNAARDSREPTTPTVDAEAAGAAELADAAKVPVGSRLDANVAQADAAGWDVRDAAAPMTMADAASADAAAADPSEEDAGAASLSLTARCSADWPDLKIGTSECRGCACGGCAAPIIDCLTVGDETQRALCRNVLACSIAHHCQVGECYCATTRCGWGTSTGDGPCAAAIDAAAGGKRAEVYDLQQRDPPPLENPFVRALSAMGCLYGTDDAAPGPTLPPMCAATCN
jgi:hypothetical protein